MATAIRSTETRGLRAGRALRGGATVIAIAIAGCVPVPVTPPEAPPPVGPPIDFTYETADGGVLTAASLRGRCTVLAFVATYDLISQAQVKVLSLVQRDHTPRVNVAALVLGPPESKPLAIAFGQSLHVAFPVALAGTSTLEGRGPFAGVRRVPSVFILDREGRILLSHTGPMEEKPLRAELERCPGTATAFPSGGPGLSLPKD
jgi:hypothetical protein